MNESERTNDLDVELAALLRDILDEPDSTEPPRALLCQVQQNSLAVLRLIKSLDKEYGATVELVDGFTAGFADLVTIVRGAEPR